jgi:iron-sulfur cluster assembly protein
VAANRIKELLKEKPESLGIIIGVKKRGCNGLSYTMNYASKEDEKNNKYEVVDSYGVKVFVDPKAVFSIVGTTMNYEESPLSSEFTFLNPNSKGKCGCGESFNV